MERSRASLGFDDPLAGFDPSDWAPDPVKKVRQRPSTDVARQVAEKTGFKSREAGQGATVVPVPLQPAPPAATNPVRRRRTGRNAQFNLKAKPETIVAFCAVADQNGWGLGETLEYAVSLLEREYGQ
ncbi:hypothetical protein [Sedimentitalea sp.]|uniref:hypothetical protein n=1 Tax=Sedimentitalea sp. TaxID=2048915 RepID=UPI0032969C2D